MSFRHFTVFLLLGQALCISPVAQDAIAAPATWAAAVAGSLAGMATKLGVLGAGKRRGAQALQGDIGPTNHSHAAHWRLNSSHPAHHRPDRNRTNSPPPPKAAIKIFWHVNARNHYKNVVLEELTAMLISGLYDRCSHIHAFVSGPDSSEVREAATLITKWGPKFIVHTPAGGADLYERLTLERIRDHVGPADKLFYLHTKGVTAYGEPREYWRRYVLYFTVRYWRTCLCLLDKYDAVGANERGGDDHHYSGNFWWTTGAFWLRHNATIGPAYTDPEFFLLKGYADAKTFNLANEQHNMYSSPAWPHEYAKAMSDALRNGADGCLTREDLQRR